jgi:hypothetical protein
VEVGGSSGSSGGGSRVCNSTKPLYISIEMKIEPNILLQLSLFYINDEIYYKYVMKNNLDINLQ